MVGKGAERKGDVREHGRIVGIVRVVFLVRAHSVRLGALDSLFARHWARP